MPMLTLVLMTIAAMLHIGFFVMESLMWRRPAVHRLFGVADKTQAEVMAKALYNQGFYNLFLGLGAVAGVALSSDNLVRDHNDLLIYTALFMIGAALVLVISDRRMIRGALVQGSPPLLALITALIV